MQLGFATAILPDLSLEEVLAFAADEGFRWLEVMCWPTDASDRRRYAGVTHIDVGTLTPADAERVKGLCRKHGVGISGLGYYPNPLAPDEAESAVYTAHLGRVIDAARLLDVGVVNTFIGRDPTLPIEAQWGRVEAVWQPIVAQAEAASVKLGIENCPMLFSLDEWPGGKNLAVSPEVWDELFRRLPSPNLGLNFDPSHLVWQGIDIDRALRDFAHKLVHVHLKDERVDEELLYRRGTLGLGWHVPKIPGLGDIDWPGFFRTLASVGWDGPVIIEVEDRAFEDSLAGRQEAVRAAGRYLRTVMELGG
ncbi:MAG: sugar phosphate isomerase/epimerase [Trueperaceae bacterium]|nr:sugar phosphate isomerase/epimerase [Trueperaceae bacterium]MCC6311449.1 sugar phosphate isomerase/epimerase [Trueperaceae bacterium]MCO5175256.1 sugar phosphate isomerase/epimerase [Trueperaceae bacterium]MCW5819653.1 sugar phosphate isomerase/epimerase [Trueperaceae bacterium]